MHARGAHAPFIANRREGERIVRVAISGAGVAGPALAHWLWRTGHEPTLIERAPALRTGGYVIDFWGIGYRLAQRMGIENALLEAGYQVQTLRSLDERGSIKARLDTGVLKRLVGGHFTSLPRSELSAAIYATIDGQVEAIFDDSIKTIDVHASGARAVLQKGGECEFDLIVGADGLHSNVRELVFGPAAQFEKYLGCQVAACVVDGYRPRDELAYITHNAPGKQIARFTLRGNRTLFLFVFRSRDTFIPGSLEQQKAVLRREFGSAGWEPPPNAGGLE